MTRLDSIITRIGIPLKEIEPSATVILYGSCARGDFHEGSDIDLLILVDTDTIDRGLQKRIKYPLYEIELETGQLISPLVVSKKNWENRQKISPFFYNVRREGVFL